MHIMNAYNWDDFGQNNKHALCFYYFFFPSHFKETIKQKRKINKHALMPRRPRIPHGIINKHR